MSVFYFFTFSSCVYTILTFCDIYYTFERTSILIKHKTNIFKTIDFVLINLNVWTLFQYIMNLPGNTLTFKIRKNVRRNII